MKVKDLINFDEIKDVVDIDNDLNNAENCKKLVSKYIISDGLKDHLIEIAKELAKPKHKSCQIIGNYGSGKSHLLAFLSALLDNSELTSDIQNEEVRTAFSKNLKRDFAVVQFELQSGRSDLSDYFYDRVEMKLDEKYGIEIPSINPAEVKDHKEKIKEILAKVKAGNPKRGLVVIIDEISDFLKQKSKKEDKYRDVQFMRVLAQASKSMDFMLIGAMQEQVFSNPEFIEEADSFGRTAERYRMVTISKEDIKEVIASRVLNKDLTQKEKLEGLLQEYGEKIPEVYNKLDEFVDLYPIHPYVIEIFNSLPYFEKRGVIQFAVDEVRKILDSQFPEFITYNRIYDLIESKHTVKHLDEVVDIVQAIETLNSKIPLMRDNLQEDARKIIKALAILKLYGQTTNNGAAPEELANELLIISDKFSSADRVEMVLNKLREVTDGQFISKTKNNYYYIDLDNTVDYDVVITRKSENLYEGAEDEELLKILQNEFELDSNNQHIRVFDDYSNWSDKKSFRSGSFIYDDGSSEAVLGEKDFNFVFVSPYLSNSSIRKDDKTAILNLEYDEEIDDLLKKIAATQSLMKNTGHPKDVMRTKQREFENKLKDMLLKQILNSKVENGGVYESSGSLLSQEPDTLAEYYYKVKPTLFGKIFTKKYSEYPCLANQVSPESIKGEVERTIEEILRTGEKINNSNAQNLLSAFDLLDNDNYLATNNSPYARKLLKLIKDDEARSVKIEGLVEKLGKAPYGLNKELVYLLIVILVYNGEINIKQRGGKTITASDLVQTLSSGLKKFKDLVYVTLEEDFPVEAVMELFKVLDLNPGLLRQKKDRPVALRNFKAKVNEIKEEIKEVRNKLNSYKNASSQYLNLSPLIAKEDGLDDIEINKLSEINTITGFKNEFFKEEELDKLEIGLKFLDNISGFLEDFKSDIYDPFIYLRKSIDFIEENSYFFADQDISKLKELADECEEILDNLATLLEYDQRRILKGKLEQYKRKYKEVYQRTHKQVVGSGVDWSKLEEINKNPELKKLNKLKTVRGLSTTKLNKLNMDILQLSKAKCNRVDSDYLDRDHKCPDCQFPANNSDILEDVNETLDDMWNQIIDIKEDWEEQILSEIENYNDNIELLSAGEQKIINRIMEDASLESIKIDNTLVKALNNLFSELEEVEISAEEIEEFIFADDAVMDYDSFSKKLDEFKQQVMASGDKDNIRIKKVTNNTN